MNMNATLMNMNATLRRTMYISLAIAVIALLSAVNAAAVNSTSNGHVSGKPPVNNSPGSILFDDGATNGLTNAFFIDGPNPGPYSQWIADQFTATGSGTLGVLDFGIWVPTGSTPTTVTWWLGTSYLDNSIGGGTAALNGTNSTYFTSNGYGFDVYNVSLTGLSSLALASGSTYYLTLGNANDSFGYQYDAWDVNGGPALCNFGVGSTFYGGCGAGGEAFTLYTSGSTTPEPGSMIMFGTGVLGLAGVLRRRINL
jgi:hypothetical protein